MPIDCQQFQFQHNFWHSEDYLSRVVLELHPDQSQKQIYYAASHASACVRQARSFLANADKVDASLQALLYYYGLLNWYKALIHLFDLEYPATTSVLQHGVSVRRTKRASYHLHSEAVYVYKEGVIQSASILADVTLPQRIGFGDAIGFSPGLREVVDTLFPSSQHLYPVLRMDGPWLQVSNPKSNGRSTKARWFVPRTCASQRGLTVEEWITEYIEASASTSHSNTMTGDGVGESPEDEAGVPPVLSTKHWREVPVGHSTETSTANSTQPSTAPATQPYTASGAKGDKPAFNATTDAGEQADPSSLKGWLELPHLTASHPWLLSGPDEYGPRLGKTGDEVQTMQVILPTHGWKKGLLLCNAQPLPNWVCEFVTLFCLASIVRYNPLEWSDIERWHNETDALFIESYLRGCPDFVANCVERLYGDMLTAHWSRPQREEG